MNSAAQSISSALDESPEKSYRCILDDNGSISSLSQSSVESSVCLSVSVGCCPTAGVGVQVIQVQARMMMMMASRVRLPRTYHNFYFMPPPQERYTSDQTVAFTERRQDFYVFFCFPSHRRFVLGINLADARQSPKPTQLTAH